MPSATFMMLATSFRMPHLCVFFNLYDWLDIFYMHFTGEDTWGDIRDRNSSGESTVFVEAEEKGKQWAQVLNYRRFLNKLYLYAKTPRRCQW